MPYRSTGMFSFCQGDEQQLLYTSQKKKKFKNKEIWKAGQNLIQGHITSHVTLPTHSVLQAEDTNAVALKHAYALYLVYIFVMLQKNKTGCRRHARLPLKIHHNKISAQHPGFCKNHAGCLKSKPIQASLGLST